MDLGVVLQTTPPSARVVDLAKRAETYGFSHVWTFDSHILWQEPYVIYSQILAETRNIIVGPMVTNPATRDWTVTASVFATLNEMYGNRTVCGIGRGDSAVRVTNGKPTSIDTLRRVGARHPRAGQRPRGRLQGLDAALPVGGEQPRSRCGSPATARGPWRSPARSATGSSSSSPTPTSRPGRSRRSAKRRSKRAATPAPSPSAWRRRPTSATMSTTPATSAAGSAGWSATTWPTSSAATATRRRCRRRSPTTSRDARATTTTSTARPATPTPTFVPDEIVDRFCLLGPVDEQVRRLDELRELGVDQFAVYLQHDAKDATLQAYGEQVIPALAEHVRAKT